MRRFTLLSTLSVVLALLLSTMAFAVSTHMTALMVPVSPTDIGQAVATSNANEVNANASLAFSQVDQALKKDVTVQKSMAMDFSQVGAVSPTVESGIYFSTSTETMKWKSLVANHAPTAEVQVAMIKGSIEITAQQVLNSSFDIVLHAEKDVGIAKMVEVAVLPTILAQTGQITAFIRNAEVTTNPHATQLVGAAVAFNVEKIMVKVSQPVGSGAVYSIFT